MKDEIEQLCLNTRYIRECEGMSSEAMAGLLHTPMQAFEELEQGRLLSLLSPHPTKPGGFATFPSRGRHPCFALANKPSP